MQTIESHGRRAVADGKSPFPTGSCGLCTTGQIFAGGEWYTPPDPTEAAYRDGSTIGCLVYLDDTSAVDTWDGMLVNANVTFNVNGFLVTLPPVGTGQNTAVTAVSIATPGIGFLQTGEQVPITSTLSPNSNLHNEHDAGAVFPEASSILVYKGVRNLTTLSIKVPAAEELYPTVTLHSPATSVMSRFSAEDIVASSRETIGAPADATVYAVDGSVIFE